MALEIGAEMGAEVCRLFAGTAYYDAPSVYQDYAGKDRVVVVQKLLSDAAAS
jgi:methylase of polypeptide subunit release factors